MSDPNTDTNTLLAIGTASVLIIGGLVYYFTNNQSEEIKPINEKELDELTKDSEDSKRKNRNSKKKNISIEKLNEEKK